MSTLKFVRGSIKGRVGQFVGSSWRGKDYIKTFTPPSNPKTEGQVAVRTIFQNIAHIAKVIVTIQPPAGDSENRRNEGAFGPEMSRLGAKGGGSPLC
jgi:hypothetical protein